jgi:hypothetical protein
VSPPPPFRPFHELLAFRVPLVLLVPLVFSEHRVSVDSLVYLVPSALTFFLELVALLVLDHRHSCYLVPLDNGLPAYLFGVDFDDELVPHSRPGGSHVLVDVELQVDRNLTDHQFVSIHSI